MTLVSVAPPLAVYAVVFQTVVYLALPRDRRGSWAPFLTGTVGAGLIVAAGVLFGLDTIGLVPVEPLMVAGWAILAVLGASMIGTVALSRPEWRSRLSDPRITGLSRRAATAHIVFRIPLLTVLVEEAFFRGVLHAALTALYPQSVALWLGAGLFGVWHVGPGLDQAESIQSSRLARLIHIVLTVAGTTLAGASLVWIRMQTGSIWAPVTVHAAANMTMAIVSRRAGGDS